MPRQHKRLQRAKFLSAVGKEETGAVVYREVGRLSPCSPFCPPCQHRMAATSRLQLPLDLPRFFHSGLCSASLHHPRGGCRGAGRRGPDPAAEPRRDAVTLSAPYEPAPKALKVTEGKNHGRGRRANRARPQLQLAQASPGCGAGLAWWCTSPCPPCIPWLGNPRRCRLLPLLVQLFCSPSSWRQLQHPQPQAPAGHDASKGTWRLGPAHHTSGRMGIPVIRGCTLLGLGCTFPPDAGGDETPSAHRICLHGCKQRCISELATLAKCSLVRMQSIV